MTRIFKLLGTKNRPYSNQALRVWWKVAAAAFFPLDTRHAGSAVGYLFFQQKTTSYPTWKMFSCLRFYNFSLPAAETAATRMSFSSYPGAITSRALGCSGQGCCDTSFTLWTSQHPSLFARHRWFLHAQQWPLAQLVERFYRSKFTEKTWSFHVKAVRSILLSVANAEVL